MQHQPVEPRRSPARSPPGRPRTCGASVSLSTGPVRPAVRDHSDLPVVRSSVSSVQTASRFRLPRCNRRSPTEFVELSLGSRTQATANGMGLMADTTFRNVINGELVDSASGETYDVVDPTTGEVYASAPKSGAEDVDRAYRAADKAFEAWGETTPAERQLALLKIADALEKRSREFVDVESRDTGKPIGFTIDEELPPAIDQIRFFAGAARVLEGKSAGEYLKDHTSFVRREPIGVVGQVTPWNYPLMMMVWKIAPALAAGNCIVLKPSDTTPASSTLLAELAAEFLPPGRAQRGHRRPRHRPPGRRAPDPAAGGDHRLGARRHAGGALRRRPAQARPPRARRQGPGHRLRRRRHRGRRRGHRRRRLLQRRPGLHRGHPRASPARASTTTSSPRSPSRPATRRPACPTTRTSSTAR